MLGSGSTGDKNLKVDLVLLLGAMVLREYPLSTFRLDFLSSWNWFPSIGTRPLCIAPEEPQRLMSGLC